MASKDIHIHGARSNNLKNITIDIPRNKLVVVTGVSGSGKSSLTIDTLYAEGQLRYVESLSSYARQFLMRMKKPDVDYIHGICPAIAIEQKVTTGNARSTVGTLTEVYDYLRLLYARIGKTISPVSGREVSKEQVSDVIDYIFGLPEDTRVQILTPIVVADQAKLRQQWEYLRQKGFSRVRVDGAVLRIEDLLAAPEAEPEKPAKGKGSKKAVEAAPLPTTELVIDRFAVADNEDDRRRAADSVHAAFNEGHGDCIITAEGFDDRAFCSRFEADGIVFEEPSHQLFNYNNPYGACPTCEGYGKAIGIDEDRVIPDKNLSVLEDCVAPWRGEISSAWREQLVQKAHHVDFPVHRAYRDLSAEEREMLWSGTKYFNGINEFFKELEAGAYKIQNRVMLARYRGKTTCGTCKGARLRKEALYVKIGGKHIAELTRMPVKDLLVFFNNLELSEHDTVVGRRLLTEITTRLQFMLDLGLNYLHLDRVSATLSGGETQRINLTRTLGSNLTSSMYILDEPSVGLHPRDTERLTGVLRMLRDLGNTVVVVEHEEDVIANADFLVDMGPYAGIHGGEVVFAGNYERIHDEAPDSLTAAYMTGRMQIPLPSVRRSFTRSIRYKGCAQHNLRSIDVTIPLGVLTVVSGVSGSGKTTLVKQIIYPSLQKMLGESSREEPGLHEKIEGDLKTITQVEMINQSPIGKSSRSNPVTYVKAYDFIRDLFTRQQLSKIRGFKPKHFSFNVEGGRCETCKGDGEIVVSMQFLADVHLMCEECNGKRFRPEVLDVEYNGKNIYEVLNMSVEEALEFFAGEADVISRLKPLNDVGLGYVKLGQSSSTLSGGEAQRVKLASFLTKESSGGHIFFIFDEPTTGLHFHDIRKLLDAINALVENGHTVLIVEHNMEVIKSADWVIDLGPEGGDGGGQLLFQGKPEDLIHIAESHTARYLNLKLNAVPHES